MGHPNNMVFPQIENLNIDNYHDTKKLTVSMKMFHSKLTQGTQPLSWQPFSTWNQAGRAAIYSHDNVYTLWMALDLAQQKVLIQITRKASRKSDIDNIVF